MKKTHKVLITIGSVVLLASVAIVILVSEARTRYTLPPHICQALFGCEPNEFFDQDLDFYTADNDFRTHATVDKDGNLILRLDEDQKNDWLNAAWGATPEELNSRETIDISPDNGRITVFGYSETAFSDIADLAFTFNTLAVRQLLNGKDPATISVTFILKDAVTGETVYTAIWPAETIHVNSDNYEFSSRERHKTIAKN